MTAEQNVDKTDTKTLEIPDIDRKVEDSGQQEEGDGEELEHVDTSAQKKEIDEAAAKRTKMLLKRGQEGGEEDEEEGGLEFSATTEVFQLTDDMKAALSGSSSNSDETVTAFQVEEAEKTPEEKIADAKKQIRAHYLKKARVLEAKINKILAGFKTNNENIKKRIALIQKHLAEHSGRTKKK